MTLFAIRGKALRALFCTALLVLVPPLIADAAQRPLGIRYTSNTTGDIYLIGNTAMTCDPTAPAVNAGNCANARAGTVVAGADLNNNNYSMVFVDETGTLTRTGSSTTATSATLNMPAGSTVLWAGLYWGAESSSGARGQVSFVTPRGSSAINASQVDSIAGAGCNDTCDRYSGFADATISLANYVAWMNRAMHGDDPAFETIPDNADLVAQYLLLYSMSGEASDSTVMWTLATSERSCRRSSRPTIRRQSCVSTIA